MDSSWINQIEQFEYKARIISIDHLVDLQNEIKQLEENDYIDPELQLWLNNYYDFSIPNAMPEIKSLIAVASRSPQIRFLFDWKEKTHAITLPPTYLDYVTEARKINERLDALFVDSNFHFYEAKNLPNKLIAVSSGLGLYGKNNLVYVDGFGSFVLLTVYYSDLPCTDEMWVPIQRMKPCEKCNLCVINCPTAALTTERKTIKSGKCITKHNESNVESFPDWMDPSSHNSLVGCMRCQAVCPKNRKYVDQIIDHTHFNEEETRLIMGREAVDKLPLSLFTRLEEANLLIHYDYLARNLSVLLN
jgi:epoxyqueuosine reductase